MVLDQFAFFTSAFVSLNAFEAPLMSLVASVRNPVLTFFFRNITFFGSVVFAYTLYAVLYELESRRLAVTGFMATTITAGFVAVLKVLFGRPLPTSFMVEATPELLIPFGFPSAHAAVAFVTATVLARSRDLRGEYVFYVLAGVVALSRVYLGVHWPTDVLAGTVIGVVFGTMLVREENGR